SGTADGNISISVPPSVLQQLAGKSSTIARARLLRRVNADRMPLRADSLCTGGNSGFAALAMALARGAARVLLLGYDMT
ncbi:hypothetical protein RA274_29020, partial [Pseudomonas syringae pv. tagetis]|uniref:hypothetical protein n=1 Tax=Pseudomonas syringae group genomosp. 7 TaxID=251699 RepID=UPI00376F7248